MERKHNLPDLVFTMHADVRESLQLKSDPGFEQSVNERAALSI